ncbi:MAG: hypothetical protein JHC61_14130 [Burkholderiaceae bacterium]|nr:hypothetical protein [Burkholderiaceae bacterium]
MNLHVSDFKAAASTGDHMSIQLDKDGIATIQTSPQSFKGRVLELLSHIPILKNLSVVQAYTQRVARDNAEVLTAFIQALGNDHSADAAAIALRRLGDQKVSAPLSSKLIERLDIESESASARLVKAAGDARVLAQARSPATGFPNQGNTCYANSSIKFLIGIVGVDPLIEHLHAVQQGLDANTSPAEAAAIEKFSQLLGQMKKGEAIDIRDFWESLASTRIFAGFDFYQMNDAQEFLAKLDTLLQLQNLAGSSVRVQETLINGQAMRDGTGYQTFSHDVSVLGTSATLQDIANLGVASEKVEIKWAYGDTVNTEVEKKRQLVADFQNFTRFNLHINALQYDEKTDSMIKLDLQNTDFTRRVTLPIVDSRSGEAWQVTLEPRDIIIHSGSATGGHYYMYSKEDDKHWVVHNDSAVRVENKVDTAAQAKFISFAVVDRTRTSPDTEPMALGG